MKKRVVVVDVTAVGSLDRAQRAILGGILAGRVFVQSRIYIFVAGEPLCGV